MDNWAEKLAIFAFLLWLYIFVANIEDRRDIGGAALWATFALIPAVFLFGVAMLLIFGSLWLIEQAFA